MADIPRIKRNVQKMVEQGAPEADIDAYIGAEGVTAEQLRTTPSDSPMGAGEKYLRLFNSYIPGWNRAAAGIRALGGENYDDALQREFRRSDEAQNTSDPVLGTAARTAGLTATTLLTGGVGMLNSLLRAGASLGQVVKEGARIGGGMGAVSGYLDSRASDPYGRAADVGFGTLGGAAVGGGLPAVIAGASVPFKWAAQNLRSGVPNAAAEFEAAGVPAFAPALSNSPAIKGIAPHIANSPFGAPLADDAARSVRALDDRVQALVDRRTPAEAGTEVQDLLRRNLTRESIPGESVKGMTPEQLHAMTGVAPGPAYNPKPPKVTPVRTEVEPVTPESILNDVASSITPIKARQANVQPQYRTLTFDDIKAPPAMQARERLLFAERDRLAKAHEVLRKEYEDLIKQAQPFKDQWRSKEFNTGIFKPRTDTEAEIFNRARQMSQQLDDLANQHKTVDAEVQKLYGAWDEMRPNLLAKAQAEANTQAEIEAARISARQQRDFTAEAERETRRLREEALANARATAETEAARKTQERRDVYAAMDRRETERLQAEAEAKWRADLEAVRGADRPFAAGRSTESYPTEFAAAYEASTRNAPRVQANLLGEKKDTVQTNVGELLSEFGAELRRSGKLPGYKGNPFDETGRVRQDLLDELRSRLPANVYKTLVYNSEARASSKLTPGIRGLHDMRTEIGRAIREIKASKYSPNPRNEDEALLARLYGAMDRDIKEFARRAGPEGEAFVRQRANIDAAYESYITGLRKPLSKIYGDKVTPEDAIAKLADSARSDKGDVNLLKAFFKVANDKGDPLKATKAILANVSRGDGVNGFLDGYRSLSPEARHIMFGSQEGRALEAQIARLSKIADRLAPYIAATERTGGLQLRDLTRGSNILLGAGLYYSFANTLGVAAGMYGLARVLASPRFAKWLNAMPGAASKGLESNEFRNHMLRLRVLAADNKEIGRMVVGAMAETLGLKPAKADTRAAFEDGDFSRVPGRPGPLYPSDLEESPPEIKLRVSAVDAAMRAGRPMQIKYNGQVVQFRPLDFIESGKGEISVVGKTEADEWRTYRIDRMNTVPPGMMKLGGPKLPPAGEERPFSADSGMIAGNQYPPDPGGVRNNVYDQNYDPTFERKPWGDRRVGPPNAGPRVPPRRFEDPSSEFYGRTGGAPSADYNQIHSAWDAVRQVAEKRWPGMFPGFGEDKAQDASMARERDMAEQRRTNRGPSTLEVLAFALKEGVPSEQIDLLARDMGLLGEWRRYRMLTNRKLEAVQ